jgi:hypothetical protein
MFPGMKLILRIGKASFTSAELLKFDWDLFSGYNWRLLFNIHLI